MPDASMEKRLEVAITATRKAGRKTLQWFQTDNLTITRKKDQSPVTAADLAAEDVLQKELLTAFPEDGFLGEETGCTKGTSEFEWVVDPIDGTKSFIQGVPIFATLVGCRKNGEGVLGVIFIPALNELAFAAVGHGAWHEQNGHKRVPARVSTQTSLHESLICSSDFRDFRRRPAVLDAEGAGKKVRDDIEVSEAGGRFTDWTGACDINAGDGIATNGSIHEDLLKLLAPSAIRGK